ncbi:MAG: caspase family protein, partial [Bacteroidaceae bacterium]|nr:caspase family protein [Bacteroidaceae bacterium]
RSAQRGREMQRTAESLLAALPNNEKLYDESYMTVEAELIDTVHADGTLHLDLLYRISYNCRHLEGWTDDYPLGAFDVDSSNSCRAICRLTKRFMETTLKDVATAGRDVDITLWSSADGTEFYSSMPYDGRYGDFRYMPVTFNGERIRISVDRKSGIANNCQLAYLRTQSVKAFLEENVEPLKRTHNNYRFITQSYKDSINTHYYRRSSIEMRFYDVFSSTVERMQSERMNDDHVDFNIPLTAVKNNDAYVLIIANENYGSARIPDVPYALNDGDVVRQYFIRALGVPERQVKLLRNATLQDIQQEGIHWLTELSQAVATKKGEESLPTANLVIYFIGHGFTDLDGVAYLMPTGINTSDIESLQPGGKKGGWSLFGCGKKENNDTTGYDIVLSKKESKRLAEQCLSLESLCSVFNAKVMPVKNLTVVVDASFDGNNRDGKPMVRSTDRKDDGKKHRKPTLRSDAVVLLAADYVKTAGTFDDHRHGFLTYFLLKEVKLQGENIFNLTYQDIFEDVERRLNKESALQNKWQEAIGIAGGKYKDGSWRELKINN